MKKLSFITLIFISIQTISFGQTGNPPGGYGYGYVNTLTPCAQEAMNSLQAELISKNVDFSLTYSLGLGYAYITVTGTPPPGRVQSCIAHYNQDAKGCPGAPVIVINYL
jgi:hypothetical protein